MSQSPANAPSPADPSYLDGPHGRIAYRQIKGEGAGFVWLGGFKSDMLGTKAETLSTHAAQNGHAYLRFDYSGHGESDGAFRDGTISDWTEDAITAIRELTTGPQILVGSSMGGWIAMLIAHRHPELIAGMILLAPAPDFTEELMWPELDQADRKKIITEGCLETPTEYSDEPQIITHALIEDGRKNLILDKTAPVKGPVRILQGMCDPDVPYEHALRAVSAIESDDIITTLIKSGDHRLSTDENLSLLTRTLDEMIDLCS